VSDGDTREMERGEARCVDSHAHVQARQFAADRAAVLQRAVAAGVTEIVCAADDEQSSGDAVRLAKSQTGVWATVGVHPHEAQTADAGTLERIAAFAGFEKVVAIGEIGLDYFRDLSPRPVQRDAFQRQLALADALGLPIVVHSRDAVEDTYTILRAWQRSRDGGVPGVLHCFGYDAEWAERFLELGYLLSIPGTVTYPNAERMQGVARMLPEERILVETDCPYLTPQPWRGKRNEPSYLRATVAFVAELRGVPAERIAAATASNARRIFRLDERMAGDAPARGGNGPR
jgi:TatD DNase family protein